MRISAIVCSFVMLQGVACSPNEDDRREKIVECSSFYLSAQSFPVEFGRAVERRLTEEFPDRSYDEGLRRTRDLLLAGQKYSENLDPAKVSSLQAKGRSAAERLVAAQDVESSVTYVKDCFQHFEALASS